MDKEKVEAVLIDLHVLEDDLVKSRDLLNDYLGVVRITSERIRKTLELLDKVGDPKVLDQLKEATKVMAGFAEQLLRATKELPVNQPIESSASPPPIVKVRKPRKKKQRADQKNSGDGEAGSHKPKHFSIPGPSYQILKALFGREKLPTSLGELMTWTYPDDKDWRTHPVKVLSGDILSLEEETARGNKSQILSRLRGAINRLRQFREGKIPEGYKATASMRYFSKLMDKYPTAEMEETLKKLTLW